MVTLHEVDDRLARRRPLRLVADHGGADAPSADLGHRGDDRVVLERPAPSAVDDAGDEVAPDEVERRRPAVDPDPVALAQRLEVLVIADGVMIVLGQMGVEVDPAPRRVSLFGSEEVRRASRWGASRVEGQRRIDAHCINEDGLPSFFIGAPCG